jgi:hypothetical protein
LDQIVQKQPNGYVFRAFLPGSFDGTIIADFLGTVPKVKKVVVVGHADEHANARYGTLTEGLKKRGIELQSLETVEVQLTDATAQVLKVSAQTKVRKILDTAKGPRTSPEERYLPIAAALRAFC